MRWIWIDKFTEFTSRQSATAAGLRLPPSQPPGVLPPLPRKPILTLREPVIESPCESQIRTVTFNLAR